MRTKTYLALGDSMSIDRYTNTPNGGAVNQFYRRLCERHGDVRQLDDRTADGQTIAGVKSDPRPSHRSATVVTMTIGGNDLLCHLTRDAGQFLPRFRQAYRTLLADIKVNHPRARVIVGNIYRPVTDTAPWHIPADLVPLLADVNGFIGRTVLKFGFRLADIHGAFLGHEAEYLCLCVEPNLAGATAIAGLFEQQAA